MDEDIELVRQALQVEKGLSDWLPSRTGSIRSVTDIAA